MRCRRTRGHDRRADGRVRLRQDRRRRRRWRRRSAGRSSTPTTSTRRGNVAKMAAGTPLDRRRPLAVARPAGRRDGGDQRARRQRRARVLGAASRSYRDRLLPRRRRPLRPSQGRLRHDRRANRRRARTATCRRRCSRASSRRSKSRADAIVVDVRDAIPRRSRRSASRDCECRPLARENPRGPVRARMSTSRQRATRDRSERRRAMLARRRASRIWVAIRASSWARSTRRCSARRRCSSRPSPSSSRRARGEYPGIGYGLHGLPTVTDLQDAVAAIEGALCARSRCRRDSPPRRCRCSRSRARATTCSSPTPSTVRRGASATTT